MSEMSRMSLKNNMQTNINIVSMNFTVQVKNN